MDKDFSSEGLFPSTLGMDYFPKEVPKGLLTVTDDGRDYYQKLGNLGGHSPAVETRLSILSDVERGEVATADELIEAQKSKAKKNLFKKEISRLINWDYLERTK